ncbi:MAG: MFS transporter [Candidatus Sabulitectum sp.]|nr:MFS transporter [Candidatus Sabulitectum sp.]
MNKLLTGENSKLNFQALLWHGIFLSLASYFMDVDTIIPSMVLNAGGNAVTLGIVTTIMIGGSSLMQIVFAGFLSNRTHKKSMLLVGINLRVAALMFLALILFRSSSGNDSVLLLSIILLISVFSFSGSFANISYMDIMGKSILEKSRKRFFSVKQTVSSVGIFISAIAVRQLLRKLSYPENYGTLLFFAGVLLLIASLGFWRLREVSVQVKNKRTFSEFLRLIPRHIAQDHNLKNYLLMINFMGLVVSFIPFMILFARSNFDLSYNFIGNILIFKVVGMLLTSIVLYKRSHKFEYKNLLFFSLICGASLPVLALLFKNNQLAYQMLFLLSGVFVSAFRVAKNGILVEISTNENRATYTGISGAGSILPTVFPLVAGVMISVLDYSSTFIIITLLVITSLIFVTKLNCRKLER